MGMLPLECKACAILAPTAWATPCGTGTTPLKCGMVKVLDGTASFRLGVIGAGR